MGRNRGKRTWRIISDWSELKPHDQYEVTFGIEPKIERLFAIWYGTYFMTNEGKRLENVIEIYKHDTLAGQ
jgi:hypothetical protein